MCTVTLPHTDFGLTDQGTQGSTKATIKLAKKGGEGPGGIGKGAHPVLSIVIESAVRRFSAPPETLRSETDPLIDYRRVEWENV